MFFHIVVTFFQAYNCVGKGGVYMNTQLNEFSKGTIVVQFDHQITIKSHTKTAFVFSDSTDAELPLYILTLETKHQVLAFRNDVFIESIANDPYVTFRSNSELIDLGVNPDGINVFQLVPPTMIQL
jgi:hypothetical protein